MHLPKFVKTIKNSKDLSSIVQKRATEAAPELIPYFTNRRREAARSRNEVLETVLLVLVRTVCRRSKSFQRDAREIRELFAFRLLKLDL